MFGESHIQLLKRNNVIREKLKLKVVSSGLVSGVVGTADFYINDKRVRTPTHRGLNIVTADPRGIFVRHRSFDTHGQNAAAAAAIQYINSIPQGHYVMVACADDVVIIYNQVSIYTNTATAPVGINDTALMPTALIPISRVVRPKQPTSFPE